MFAQNSMCVLNANTIFKEQNNALMCEIDIKVQFYSVLTSNL